MQLQRDESFTGEYCRIGFASLCLSLFPRGIDSARSRCLATHPAAAGRIRALREWP